MSFVRFETTNIAFFLYSAFSGLPHFQPLNLLVCQVINNPACNPSGHTVGCLHRATCHLLEPLDMTRQNRCMLTVCKKAERALLYTNDKTVAIKTEKILK